MARSPTQCARWTRYGIAERTGKWCPGTDSNRRHCDFQSHALPTELPGHAVAAALPKGGAAVGVRAYGEGWPPWQGANSFLFGLDNLGGNFFGQGGPCGHCIAITEPLREIAVAAAGRAERLVLFDAGFLADRAGPIHAPPLGQRLPRWQVRDRFRSSASCRSVVRPQTAIRT